LFFVLEDLDQWLRARISAFVTPGAL